MSPPALDIVKALVPIPDQPFANKGDWAEAEAALNTELPADYKDLVDTYGTGTFDDLIRLHSPFARAVHFNMLALSVSDLFNLWEYRLTGVWSTNLLPALAIFGGQALLRRAAAQGAELQAKLLGKWELFEPLSEDFDPGEIWFEVRPDDTILWCTMSTVHIDGKLSSKAPQLRTYEYKVPDENHLLLDPGKDSEHSLRVVLRDDEVTLSKDTGRSNAFAG
jgi:hypothetical protein